MSIGSLCQKSRNQIQFNFILRETARKGLMNKELRLYNDQNKT
jgi:hypothetical protein